jgi:transcriptional regulator with XRE-family HTH domain
MMWLWIPQNGCVQRQQRGQTVSERPIPVGDDQRQRQRDVLTALWKAKQAEYRQLTQAAARIGVSTSQLTRYLSGETVLPSPYYQAVADAFGIDYAELVRRLLPVEEAATAEEADAFRSELHALIPQSPGYAEDLYREHADDSRDGQQSVLRFVTRLTREGLLVIPERFRTQAPKTRSHPPNRAEPSEPALAS